jgi:hypothetical protein
MTNLMRWISRSVFHAHGHEDDAPAPASFERVDASGLAATDFRASDAMRLNGVSLDDFCETTPAFVRSTASGGVVGRP